MIKFIKNNLKACSILFLLLILFNRNNVYPCAVDKIVAIVNDSIILDSEVKNFLDLECLLSSDNKCFILNKHELYRNALERVILDTILLQVAKKNGIMISDRYVHSFIESIARDNNVSINQLKNFITSNGIEYSSYLEQIKKELLITKIYNNEIRSRIIILPEEIETTLKQISNKHNLNTKFILTQILIPIKNYTKQKIDILNKYILQLTSISKKSDTLKVLVKYLLRNNILFKINNISGKLVNILDLYGLNLLKVNLGDILGPIYSKSYLRIFRIDDFIEEKNMIPTIEVHIKYILINSPILLNQYWIKNKLKSIKHAIYKNSTKYITLIKNNVYKINLDSLDLGWKSIKTFSYNIRESILKLRKGELSDPIYFKKSWKIIQLLGIRSNNISLRKNAFDILFKHKFIEETKFWTEELLKNSYIKIIEESY